MPKLNAGCCIKSRVRVPAQNPKVPVVISLKVNREASPGRGLAVAPRRHEDLILKIRSLETVMHSG